MVEIGAIWALDGIGEGDSQLLENHGPGRGLLAGRYLEHAGMVSEERSPSRDQFRQQPALVVTMVNYRKLRPVSKDVLFDRMPVEIHKDGEIAAV
jgi:hypothetical protein